MLSIGMHASVGLQQGIKRYMRLLFTSTAYVLIDPVLSEVPRYAIAKTGLEPPLDYD